MEEPRPKANLYTDEAKSERFIRVAAKRTDRLLNDMRLLGNTSNKSLYKYSQDDIDKIFGAIDEILAETRTKFKPAQQRKPFTFD